MNILLKLEAEEKPDEVAVAFDLPKPHLPPQNVRATTRVRARECRRSWPPRFPLLKELLTDLGYKMVTCGGATRPTTSWAPSPPTARPAGTSASSQPETGTPAAGGARHPRAAGRHPDGPQRTTVMDEAAVREKYGVEPRQLIEVKSPTGRRAATTSPAWREWAKRRPWPSSRVSARWPGCTKTSDVARHQAGACGTSWSGTKSRPR